MRNETRMLLQKALELMTQSISSNEASSARLILEARSPFPAAFEIEIRRTAHGSALEVAITGAGIRGARESLRVEDFSGLVEAVISRMSFSFGNEGIVVIRVLRTAADAGRYLPSYVGSTQSGELETMSEPVRVFVESAVEQAVRALLQEGCQESELLIQPQDSGDPVRIRLETSNDGVNTRGSSQLYVMFPSNQFCLSPNSGEVVAFVMGRLSALVVGDSHPQIQLQKRDSSGLLPPIRLAFADAAPDADVTPVNEEPQAELKS